MAVYGNLAHLKQISNWDGWNKVYGPGDEVPHSGIYRCTGCKKEVTCNAGDKFPPQNLHQHGINEGSVVWQIIVYTDTKGKYI